MIVGRIQVELRADAQMDLLWQPLHVLESTRRVKNVHRDDAKITRQQLEVRFAAVEYLYDARVLKNHFEA